MVGRASLLGLMVQRVVLVCFSCIHIRNKILSVCIDFIIRDNKWTNFKGEEM